MVKIQSAYLGDLRCSIEHGPSGAAIQTDAPKDNHGKGEAFSPTDLVGAALVACVMTIMAVAARRLSIQFEGARGRVEKQMAKNPHRRIARLDVVIENLPKGLDEQQRVVLERAGNECPVRRSLHQEMEVKLVYRWD